MSKNCGERNRPLVGTSRFGWPKSPRALAGRLRRTQILLRTLGIEIVFGRKGRLGMRTIRITAMGKTQSHDIVSTVSRVSDNEYGAKSSSGRTGTGALIAQTMLTMLTQSIPSHSLERSPRSKLMNRSIPIWSRAPHQFRKENRSHCSRVKGDLARLPPELGRTLIPVAGFHRSIGCSLGRMAVDERRPGARHQ